MPLKNIGDMIYGTLFGGTAVPPQHKKRDGSWVETGENDPLPIVPRGDLNSFVTGAISVAASAVELKVGASTLSGRKQLLVYPPSTGTIYWGATNGVTAATGAPLKAGDDPLSFDFANDAVKVWAIGDSTARDIRVVESK